MNYTSTTFKKIVHLSPAARFLSLLGILCLFSLLAWRVLKPDSFGQFSGQVGTFIRQSTYALSDRFSGRQQWEYMLKAPHQQCLEQTGVCLSTGADLGRTTVTLSHRPVTIDKRSSIRKVVGIHPEHDEELDAQMTFTYADNELNGLDESKLILYSSTDDGLTWQPHLNSVTDVTTNTIRLDGIRHFSLWTAAYMVVQGPGCVTTGIGAWWRSDIGASTSAWTDFSTNGYNTKAVGTPTYNATGANFNPMVKFNSNYYQYTVGIFKNAPGIVNTKVFAVTIPVNGAYNHPWGEYTTNGHNYMLLAPHYNNVTYFDGPYGHRITNTFSTSGGQYGVPNIVAGERSQNNMSIRTNGKVQNFPGSYGGTFTSHTNLNFLGAYNGVPSNGNSGLAEVIVYRDASSMTATQVQKIESYLALKYGITLDQTTPRDYLAGDGTKMWDATVNGTFKYNITGIGREDCQSLHQKQSKSVNLNQFITFATGASIKTDNASNTSGVIADKSFLVWADNNASATTTVAVSGSNVSDRMTRVWRVSKTNWSDQNITIKAAGYANRYLIIHNTSATFATAPSQEILLDFNGQATFNSSLLPDGAYFTFGNLVKGPACINAGIGAWWRADQEMSGTSWVDYSGNGYTANAVNGPVAQTTGANYNPFVKLANSYYQYNNGIFKTAPGIVNSRVFTVIIPTSGQYNNPWGEYTTNGYNYFLHAPYSNDVIYHDGPYGHRTSTGFTASGGQYGIPNIVSGERTQSNMSIRTNGRVQNFPNSYGGTFLSHTTANYVGAVNGQPSSNCGLAEVIVYRDGSALTGTDMQKIESYLALKYGITLDQSSGQDYLASDGSKMWDASVNAAFRYNIAGLGRDNCGLLHQKQSKSSNPAQFITLAVGSSVALSNAANTNAVTTDKSFLTWGDNGASVSTTVSVTGANVTDRMSRVWRVDKTNWSDQNITFKAVGYANRYLLIHNSSASFATAPTQEILLDGGGSATFNSSLLPDGAYFTIGGVFQGPGAVNSGIGGWWRADQFASATEWKDFSGNDHTATANGVPVFNTTGANFNPLVKFNGNNYQYTEGIFKNSPGIVNSKVFTVVMPVSGQYTEPWGEYTTNGHNYHIHGPHANGNIYHDAPYGHRVQTGFAAQGGQYGIPNIVAGERTQTNMSIRTNGKVLNQPGNYTGVFTAHTNLNYLGASYGLNSSGNSGVAEVIVYRDASTMTATDIQKIESYLALKYGITLDQTTARDYLASDGSTKMWDATANAAFKYNIAGLGRDNVQLLHQKQSKSVNPGQFITFAVGDSILAANGSIVPDITANKSFLVWGDNNSSRFSSVAVTGSSNVTGRMARVWRVDKTNWTDQNITIEVTNYPNRYLLIHNTSASFATAPSQEILLDGQGKATFNSSLLPDGAYFTIGDALKGPGCVNAGIGAWWKSDYQLAGTFWNDYSGNDKNAVNAGTPTVQSTGANYNPMVKFYSNHYKYDEGIFKDAPGIVNTKLFTVVIPVSGQYSEPWGEWMSNSQPYHIHAPHSNGNMYHDAPYGHRIQAGFVAQGGQFGVPNIVAGERTPTNMSLRTNGKVLNQAGSYGGTFTANTALNYIGAYHGLASSGGCGVAEVIVYRDASSLTATDVQKIESYLALKYGITLDQTTPRDYLAGNGTTKMWDATVNAAYKYNIAGIGRDNCQQLHQKQSKSVNPKQFIVFALGDSIAASNTNNPKSVTNDNSYLTWSDNNADRFASVAVTAVGVTQRMARVWKVDKTNWADQNITFQAQGYPNRYLLIHNSSATFASAPTQEILLDGNGSATFSSSLLPDGAFFTIGDAILGPGCVNAGVGAWWKADYEMDATHWSDYSGNDKYMTTTGSPTPYVSGANFNPMVKFNGNHYDYTGNGIFENPITAINTRVFVVSIPVNGQNTAAWGERQNNGQNMQLLAPWSDNTVYHDAPYGNRVQQTFSTQGGIYDAPNLLVGIRTASNMAIRLQGKQINNNNANYSTGYTTTAWSHVGAVPGTASGGNTGLAEVIVYRDATNFTPVDLQKVESYLALKYGITLDQTTPRDYLAGDGSTKMWDATVNATYRYNIAGMGKDICQQLHQKQSRSVNPNQFITFASGSNIPVSNNTNTSTVTNDKSFLVWGDNNGTLQASISVNASTVSERSGRIWRVDKTNWADQDITFRAQGYPNRALLISNTDPTFSGVPDQEITLDGTGSATFSSSLLPDGAYFTLGNVLVGPGNVNVGVASWFDASEMDEGVMVQGTGWSDKSGWHRDMLNINANSDPDVQQSMINFNKGAFFDGDDVVYQPSYGEAFTAGEVFSVGQTVDVSNRGPMFDFGGAGNVTSHYTWGNGGVYESFGTNIRVGFNPETNVIYENPPGLTVTGASYSPTQWNIYNVASATNDWFAGFNGLPKAVRTTNTPTFTGNTNMHIGWRNTYYNYGRIAEVVHYNRKLTAAERQKVHSYLALKYGITLDQTNPYNYVATNGSIYWDATANVAFKYNIAGVGRDNFTNLNQKQSKSVNPGQFITMSVGAEIAASNAANASVITTDRSYFVWGDNNAGVAVPVAVTATNVTERMARVWRVDKTANWSDQNITFRAQGYPNRYLIIHNTSATFATAPDQEVLLDSLGRATFNTSLLPDGAYFTIGDAVRGPGCVNLGAQLWIKGDFGLSSGASWSDFSGNDVVVKQTVTGERPTYLAGDANTNFNPALLFAGVNNLDVTNSSVLASNGLLTNAGGTVVAAVMHNNVAATWGDLYNQGTDNPTFGKYHGTANFKIYDPPAHTADDVPLSFVQNRNHVAIYDFSNTASSYSGHLDGKTHNLTHAAAPSIAMGATYIGGENGIETWLGNIYEMAVYNRELTAAELKRVNSYFGLKYGITLDQTTPNDYVGGDGTTKMWDATVNAAHRYNIAGLGRDNCSTLNQKQSRSGNASQFITMAVGDSIAINNASSVATITNDKSFLVWGDDNGSQTNVVAVTATNVTERMARVWRVDKTNWADQNITFKATGYGNRYLIISNSSATFATVNQEILLDAAGQATFNSNLLPDGAYFTIGDALKGPGCVNLGVKMWFRPDYDLTTGAGKVTQWADYSGNDVIVAQTNVARQPTYSASMLNFNPGATFAGGSDGQVLKATLNSMNGNSPYTIFALHKPDNTSSNLFAIGNPAANQHIAYHPNYGSGTRLLYHMSDDLNGGAPRAGWQLNTFRYDALASGTDRYIYDEGKQVASGVTNVQNVPVNPMFSLGGYDNRTGANGEEYDGDLVEFAVYNQVLTAAQRNRVESYFALKYGLTLDQTTLTDYIAGNGTTKMWDATVNTGYNNDIAGIGRDNCQALYQKQSKSINADALVTMGNGEIAASNALNTSTLPDNTFMVWGNNNGAISWQVGESPSSRIRLTREWRIDETGTVGTVKIQVPDNGSALSSKLPGEATTVYLLVDADGDFSSGATEVAMTLNGTDWEADYDFSDGQYFTFGTQVPPAPGSVVDNLNLWLKADAGTSSTTDNAVLDLWNDQTTNGYHATQTVAGEKPSYQSDSLSLFNFNSTVGFSGSKDFVNNTMPLLDKNAYTVFSVLKRTAVTNYGGVFSQNLVGNAGQPATTYLTTTNNIGINAVNQSATNVGVTDPLTGQFMLRNTGNAGTVNIVMNGGSPNASGAYPGTQTGTVTGYYIGRHNSDLALSLNGNIAEVAVYKTGTLTAAQVNAIESYFAVKYGLMLGHDYVSAANTTIWDIGATGGYDNRIAGIGRDDSQALYQKQSKSAVNGALVTIGNGNLIVGSNTENSSTFSADASYLMAGDNNGSLGWQLAETPANRQRLSREWRVFETGTVGSVKIRVPDNSSPLTTKMPGEVSTIYLLTDADGDFSSGSTETAMTLTGTDWEANIDLSNGQYFTFATNVPAAPGCEVSNLSLWLKANAGVSGAPTVTGWTDQSTYANPITVVGAPQITSAINFNPAIVLAAGKYFTTPNAAHLNPTTFKVTVFGVTRPTTLGFNAIIGKTDDSGWSNGYGLYTNANQKIGFWEGDQSGVEPANVPHQAYPSTPFIGTGYYDTNQKVSVNGAASTSATQTPTLSSSQVEIGYTKTFQFNGDYAEVILYNNDVGANARDRIESYLALKYGITMTHDYLSGANVTLWDIGNTGGYDNDIAGISRDDCQGLEQKQSKSVSSDALITIGNGNTIAATNAANTSTFGSDASFMLWGNNNGAIAWQTTEAPASRQRLTREWKIAESGNIGSVKIRVPDNSSALTSKLPAETSTVFLLVDDDGDFSSGATEIPMSANGTDWDVDYDLLDGKYITFGTETCNPIVTGNPVDVTLCAGGNAVFTVTGFGSGLTYQWQESTNGGATFTNISGATSASYTKSSVTLGMNSYQYRAIISNSCAPAATSTAAILTVNTAPAITAQPMNISVCEGATATFGVTANGSGMTFQWQENLSGTWTDISGETFPTLSVSTTLAMNARQYRVVITGTCTPVVTSNTATLTVNAAPTITTQPSDLTVCAGQNAAFSVVATGTNLSYQWQENTAGSWSNISGATSASFTKTGTTAAMDGYQYRVIISGDCPLPITSNSVIMTVNTLPAITTQPTAQTVCEGITATFNVVATATGVTYQWQESTNGGATFTNISGETAATFSKTGTTAAMSGYQYRVVIGGTCSPSVTSSAVILTVDSAPAVTAVPVDATICAGANHTFSVTASGTGLSYQWQESTNSGVSFSNIGGATANFYTVSSATTAMNGNQYRVVVSGTCPSPITVNAVTLNVNALPAINTQPVAVTVCAGADATFNVAASGTGLSYQWQESTNGGGTFANISGATAASFTKVTTTSAMDGYQYRVIVSGSCTPAVTSSAVTLTVNSAPGIGTQPTAQVVCAGQNATFSVTASGTNLTYQWQENAGSGFVNISGATSASYTKASTTVAMNGYEYQVIITGICPSPVTSGAVSLTVNALPGITTQPIAQTVCAGQTATFTAAATGTGLSYQWQDDSGGSFANISGAIGASYTTAATTTAMSGRQYRVVVSGICTPTLTSNAVALTVNALPAIGTQPVAQTVCAGTDATFSVAASGTGLTYQWQENTGSGFVNISGATSASYTKASTTSAMSGYEYQVIVSGACTPALTSSAVLLTVNTAPGITTQPLPQTVCAGANATFTAAATGTGATYQWQENTGSGFVNIGGATSASYTKTSTTTAMNGYLYRVIVSGVCPSPINSSEVSLTVNALPAITTQPTAQTACAGENATFSVVASGTSLTYQWQESSDGGATFTNISGETNATFVNTAVTGAMSGRQYRVIVSGTCTPPVTSGEVALTVNVSPSITAQPSSATLCSGQNATFTVAGTGTFLTYQWQESTNGGATFTNISGATNPSYTKAAVTSGMSGYQYRVILNGPCVPLTSDIVLLTVNTAPAISTQPAAATVCAGVDATFSVSASGTGLTYQWQESTNGGGTFTDIGGATASSFSKNSTNSSMNGYQYRVIVTGVCTPALTSNIVTLTVNALPNITAQPNSTTQCEGNNAIYSVTASGTGLSYQWQENTGSGFVNVPGATASIFVKSSVTPAMSGYLYRVTVSGTCTPPVTSNAASLTVNAAPAVTTQPAPVITCEGANVVYSVVATGSVLTYQWQEDTGSGFTDIPGATGTSYTKTGITSAMNGYQYHVIVSGACSPAVTSGSASLTVTTAPTITAQPTDVNICSGANAVFSVTTTGSGVAYQWQVNDGFGYVDIPGAINATYTKVAAPNSYNGYLYRVIVGGVCPPGLTSNVATLTIQPGPAINTHPVSIVACTASNATFSVSASGPGLSYQWQENTGSGFVNISGATSDNYTKSSITLAMNGYSYRVLVTGTCAPTLTSNVAIMTVEAPPAMTTQPSSAAVCEGANATFTSVASGSGISYQWQENTGSGFVDIAGATSASYTKSSVTAAMNGYTYRVNASGACSPPTTSSVVTLTVNVPPAITTQPADVVACVGLNGVFSVSATGAGLSYQWQEDTGSGFVNIAGATSASYTKTGVTSGMNNYQYRVIVSGSCTPPVTSNPATLTVTSPPAIILHPSASTTCAGENAIFSVMTTGSGLTYQWQENTGSGFVNIVGATSDVYTKTAVTLAMSSYTYRVLISGACPPALTSSVAGLTVISAPVVTASPAAVTLCVGGNATFSATATGDGSTYQWQENTGSGFVDIAGATSASYTKSSVTAGMTGYQYHVVVSGTCAPSTTSGNALLTVNTPPAITTQPAAVTLCAGADATFNVTATGSGLAYQWQENTGSGYVNIAGANSASYTKAATSIAMNGYLYQVIVSGTCTPPVTSTPVALTINTAPAISTQPTAVSVCAGADATFNVTASGTGLTYQWQENTGSGYVDIAGATSASYTKAATTSAMNSYLYRVIVSGTCTPPATSNGVALTVNTAPVINVHPASTTVCATVNATFTVAAIGSGLTYQWQENTGSGFVNISGANAASYTKVAPTGAMDGYLYRVIVGGICTPQVTSDPATMTVQSGPAITSQPVSTAVNEGLNATFNVTATGTGLTYQWQENTGSGFVNIPGGTSASYTKMNLTSAMNGYLYRVIVNALCLDAVTSNTATLTVNLVSPVLAVKAYLGGAYDESTSKMHDKLRVSGQIPNAQPYNGSQYSDFAYNGTETIGAGVLAVTGDNAIVDWVLLELRNSANPTVIVARKAALIQRDGDIVSATDGISSVTFSGTAAGSYYVAMKHRNHLGVMTLGSLSLSGMLTTIDFTNPATSNYQLPGANGSVHAQQELANGKRVLWAGNFSNQGSTGNRVINQGNDADPDEAYYRVLLDPGNVNVVPNYVVTAYDRSDGNLDGNVIYQGNDSDSDIPFYTVFLFPGNLSSLPNYIIFQQIP